jgi:hypothetical protein
MAARLIARINIGIRHEQSASLVRMLQRVSSDGPQGNACYEPLCRGHVRFHSGIRGGDTVEVHLRPDDSGT